MLNVRGALVDYKILLQRIISTSILIPIVVLGIFYLPNNIFSFSVAIVLSLAAWEWSILAGLSVIWQRFLYIGLLWWGFSVAQLLLINVILWISLTWWLIVFYLILFYPRINKKLFRGWPSCLLSFFIFIPFLIALSALHKMALGNILFVLCLIWAADSGAYFFGTIWGKHKLVPKISPGKTIEGLCGGIVTALIVAAIFAVFAKIEFSKLLPWAVLIILVLLFSVLGDLFESIMKRQAGVKDSGRWILGHGGILDRIDSLTAAVPMFALGLLLFMN
jgi:phosphatidate cytidylyltransferase